MDSGGLRTKAGVAVGVTLPGANQSMPMYNYQCPGCKQTFRLIRTPEKALLPVNCATCDTQLVRKPAPPSSMAKEVLDNGMMARQVERLADIEEIVVERSKTKEDRGP